jgi:hypothetical protein
VREEELNRIAAELGRRAVARVDEDRVVAAVLGRLASEPPEPVVVPIRSRVRLVLVSLAAAASIMLAVWLYPSTPTAPVAPTAFPSLLTELDGLEASELELLLETIPPPAKETRHQDGALLEDLDARALERLLRSLEG